VCVCVCVCVYPAASRHWRVGVLLLFARYSENDRTCASCCVARTWLHRLRRLLVYMIISRCWSSSETDSHGSRSLRYFGINFPRYPGSCACERESVYYIVLARSSRSDGRRKHMSGGRAHNLFILSAACAWRGGRRGAEWRDGTGQGRFTSVRRTVLNYVRRGAGNRIEYSIYNSIENRCAAVAAAAAAAEKD